MEREKREKLWVFALTFAFFIGGVATLSMDRGPMRTLVLAGCFVALIAIAARQTIKRLKKKEKK